MFIYLKGGKEETKQQNSTFSFFYLNFLLSVLLLHNHICTLTYICTYVRFLPLMFKYIFSIDSMIPYIKLCNFMLTYMCFPFYIFTNRSFGSLRKWKDDMLFE